MYTVTFVYDFFAITLSVEADSVENATDTAIDLLTDELGVGVAMYNYVDVEGEDE